MVSEAELSYIFRTSGHQLVTLLDFRYSSFASRGGFVTFAHSVIGRAQAQDPIDPSFGQQ
jgi:hypothetical protein